MKKKAEMKMMRMKMVVRYPRNTDEVLPQLLADYRKSRRLAMILSLSLSEIQNMTVDQRIRQ